MTDLAENSEAEFVLPACPGLEDAVTLAAELRELPQGTPLCFDASAVTSITTPYILTLISAIESADHPTAAIRMKNAAPALVDGFTDLGLFPELMKMEFVA